MKSEIEDSLSSPVKLCKSLGGGDSILERVVSRQLQYENISHINIESKDQSNATKKKQQKSLSNGVSSTTKRKNNISRVNNACKKKQPSKSKSNRSVHLKGLNIKGMIGLVLSCKANDQQMKQELMKPHRLHLLIEISNHAFNHGDVIVHSCAVRCLYHLFSTIDKAEFSEQDLPWIQSAVDTLSYFVIKSLHEQDSKSMKTKDTNNQTETLLISKQGNEQIFNINDVLLILYLRLLDILLSASSYLRDFKAYEKLCESKNKADSSFLSTILKICSGNLKTDKVLSQNSNRQLCQKIVSVRLLRTLCQHQLKEENNCHTMRNKSRAFHKSIVASGVAKFVIAHSFPIDSIRDSEAKKFINLGRMITKQDKLYTAIEITDILLILVSWEDSHFICESNSPTSLITLSAMVEGMTRRALAVIIFYLKQKASTKYKLEWIYFSLKFLLVAEKFLNKKTAKSSLAQLSTQSNRSHTIAKRRKGKSSSFTNGKRHESTPIEEKSTLYSKHEILKCLASSGSLAAFVWLLAHENQNIAACAVEITRIVTLDTHITTEQHLDKVSTAIKKKSVQSKPWELYLIEHGTIPILLGVKENKNKEGQLTKPAILARDLIDDLKSKLFYQENNEISTASLTLTSNIFSSLEMTNNMSRANIFCAMILLKTAQPNTAILQTRLHILQENRTDHILEKVTNLIMPAILSETKDNTPLRIILNIIVFLFQTIDDENDENSFDESISHSSIHKKKGHPNLNIWIISQEHPSRVKMQCPPIDQIYQEAPLLAQEIKQQMKDENEADFEATIQCSSYQAMEEFLYHLSCANLSDLNELSTSKSLQSTKNKILSYSMEFCIELLLLAHKFGSNRLKSLYLELCDSKKFMSGWSIFQLLCAGFDIESTSLCKTCLQYILENHSIEKMSNDPSYPDRGKLKKEIRDIFQKLILFIT